MSSINSEAKLGAAPLIKARGVPTSSQNKIHVNGGEKVTNSVSPSTTTTTAARFQNSATENFLCLREKEKCTRPRMDGQKYCLQHIKPDRESIYRQCNYVSSRNGKRCFNVTIKSETGKEGFCINHARLVTFYRRRTANRNRFRDTPDTLLENINHFLTSNGKDCESKAISQQKTNRPRLDYYSESSDDETKETVLDTKSALEDSDMEIDESEDPLKHAGIYTSEEIVRMTLEKMTNLRELYGDYLKVLNRKYKLKRQKYLRSSKAEGEAHGPLSVLVRTFKDKKKMKQLRALRRYSKHFGKEALLHKQSKERKRNVVANLNDSKLSNLNEKFCSYSTNDVNCSNEPLPSSPYCLNHILHDERQIIFKKCAKNDCSTSVCQCLPFEQCWLHRPTVTLSADYLTLPFKFDFEKPKLNYKIENDKLKSNQKVDDESLNGIEIHGIDPKPINTFAVAEEKSVVQPSPILDTSFLLSNETAPVNATPPNAKEQETNVALSVSRDPSQTRSNRSGSGRKRSSPSVVQSQVNAPPALIAARQPVSNNHRRSFDSNNRIGSFEHRRSFDHTFASTPFEKELVLPPSSSNSSTHRTRKELYGDLVAPALFPAKYSEDTPLPKQRTLPNASRSSNNQEHSYGRT